MAPLSGFTPSFNRRGIPGFTVVVALVTRSHFVAHQKWASQTSDIQTVPVGLPTRLGDRSQQSTMRNAVMPIPDPDLSLLVGSWRLVSAGATFTDNGERVETWGLDPVGRMMLDVGGRIMFIFTKPNRQPPTNDADRATLFNELLSIPARCGWTALAGSSRRLKSPRTPQTLVKSG
jgi:hypothetical protein